jgi:DNA-binding transcriptional ArsR family regulator
MTQARRADTRKELENNDAILSCAKQFGVVGDATRLKICYLLCHYPELSVGAIAEKLGTSMSVVSHSLKKMLELELVQKRKNAQTAYYSLGNGEFLQTVTKMLQ